MAKVVLMIKRRRRRTMTMTNLWSWSRVTRLMTSSQQGWSRRRLLSLIRRMERMVLVIMNIIFIILT